MKTSLTRGLVVAATALSGIATGTSFDKSIVQLPAWDRVGAEPWAAYSREADLRDGLIWYPAMGIGTLLANVAAAIAVYRDPAAPRSAALPTRAAALLAVGHMLATARAAPNMLRVRRTEDPDSLKSALEGFTRWQAVRTGLDTLMFAANLWSLASVSKREPRRGIFRTTG
jgi:hypothetical protein